MVYAMLQKKIGVGTAVDQMALSSHFYEQKRWIVKGTDLPRLYVSLGGPRETEIGLSKTHVVWSPTVITPKARAKIRSCSIGATMTIRTVIINASTKGAEKLYFLQRVNITQNNLIKRQKF